MKSKKLLVLACLVSMPVFSQSLPDEINYTPYDTRYRTLERNTNSAQEELNQSQASLAEITKYISDMNAHIASLESEIANSQNEIVRLRQEIPQLERQILALQNQRIQIENDLRNKKQQHDYLEARYREVVRDIRPLEQQVQRKEVQVQNLRNELVMHQRTLRDAENRLAVSVNEANRIDRQFEDERGRQRTLEAELRSADNRIKSIETEIIRNNNTISTQNSELATSQRKFDALDNRVKGYQEELNTLRTNNAPAAEIQVVQRKLAAATNSRDQEGREIKKIEAQIASLTAKNENLKKQIADIRQSQSTLPARIAQSEARQRELTAQRSRVQQELNRSNAEVNSARRNVEIRSNTLQAAQVDLRNDQIALQRQRELADNLARDAANTRNEINSLSEQSRRTSEQIIASSEQIQANQSEIPRIEQSIRDAQKEISNGRSELAQAEADQQSVTAQVANNQRKLDEVTRARDVAKNERDSRFNLYQRYLGEAEVLGAGQAAAGSEQGAVDGQRLSAKLAQKNGAALGADLGTAEAKYWASVRGEIAGYEDGHNEGLNSTEDRTRAINEASQKAALDAELFAQRNFKPQFFEEFVQAEFKKPVQNQRIAAELLINKALFQNMAQFASMEANNGVGPLSPNEIAKSKAIKTPLDASIDMAAKGVKEVESKVESIRSPEVTYVEPSSIPVGSANCSQVYKGLAVFKAACEGSYKGQFANNYRKASFEAFSANYTNAVDAVIDSEATKSREMKYPSEFSAANKIAKAEGLKVGKIEIYNQTYEVTYAQSYDSEIKKAQSKAKNDAAMELTQFLAKNPLLTLAETKLQGENFRGDEEVSLLGKVKNVGAAALNGPVIVRITDMVNASASAREISMSDAAPMTLTDLPELKVKINPEARAGQKLVVRGVIVLPGDLYKASRQETFEVTQVLSANPAHELSLKYDSTPDIKGVFRRKIHTMDINIQPSVDDIAEGYQVSLKAVGLNAETIDQNGTEQSTGALTANMNKKVQFSYSFKDQAKNKTVTLELTISYKDKVIKKEMITLQPH